MLLATLFPTVILYELKQRRSRVKQQATSSSCVLFIKSNEEGWSCARRIIRERMNYSKINYIYLASSRPEREPLTALVLYGASNEVFVEKEVMKTSLNALCSSVRIEDKCVDGDMAFPTIVKTLEDLRGFTGVLPLTHNEAGIIDLNTYDYPIDNNDTVFRPHTALEDNGNGKIYIGVILNTKTPSPLYITLDDVMGRVGIFGSTGTGKSTTASIIAYRLSKVESLKNKGGKVVIIDWHGEYSMLMSKLGASFYEVNPVKNDFRIGFFCYDSMGVDEIVEFMGEALTLTPPQANILARIVRDNRPRNIEDLSRLLETYEADGYWGREIRHALLRKIYMIVNSRYFPLFNGSCGNAASTILGSPDNTVVVNLFRVKNTFMRRLLAFAVISELYYISREKHTETVLVIDEAQNLMGGDSSLFSRIVVEGRKFGLGVILVTQNPSILPRDILLNLNTKVIHAIRSGEDKKIIQDSMSLNPIYVGMLDKLGKGEALIQSPTTPLPVLVRVDTADE